MLLFYLIAIVIFFVLVFQGQVKQKQENEEKVEQIVEEYKNSELQKLFVFECYGNNLIFFRNKDNTVFEIYREHNQNIKFNASELRKVELYEDNTCAMSVGRAVVGGALFGTAGAIVGGSSGKNKIEKLTMVIYTNNLKEPQFSIPIIISKTSKDSTFYTNAIQFARNVMGALEIVIEENKEN